MQRPWDGEGETGDGGVKLVALVGTQGVGPLHGAYRGVEHRPAGVGKRLPGSYVRLFADHALTPHLLDFAVGIGNQPMAAQQPGRYVAIVGNADGVGKHIAALLGCRLRGNKMRGRSNDDFVFLAHCRMIRCSLEVYFSVTRSQRQAAIFYHYF